MHEKTKEELQKEAYERMKNAEYMNEVAMPGVVLPVNPDDIKH